MESNASSGVDDTNPVDREGDGRYFKYDDGEGDGRYFKYYDERMDLPFSGEGGMEPLLPPTQISSFESFGYINEMINKDNFEPKAEKMKIVDDIISNLNVDVVCPSGYDFPGQKNLQPKHLSKDSHFFSCNRLGIKVAGKRVVVRSEPRKFVTLEALSHQCGVPNKKGQLVVKGSYVLQANSVSVVSCQLLDRHRYKSVFVSGTAATEDGECQITEGIYDRDDRGIVKILVGNTTDSTRGLARGSVFSCDLLAPTQMKVAKSKLDHGIVQEMEDAPEEDSVTADDVMDKKADSATFEELWSKLKLDENDILNQNQDIRRKTRRLIHDYQDIFSYSAPGETDLVELDLKLKPGTQPIRQKFRPLNPKMEEDLDKQIKDWLTQGVIEESDSPWSSPLVPVKKKDGSVRWAVDYRRVNNSLVQDSFPLPRIQTLLEKAGGHQVYSTLDATQAYFNIRINPKSRKVTAFATPSHLYHFIRMPFGISTAPAVYSRFIAAALNRLGTRGINVYLDDVLLYSMTLTEHLERMREVFEAHRTAGVKLKPSKTFLFQSKVAYLGHMLSSDGISMIDSYMDRIKEWPVPTTTKELNTMLGFFGYYRSFIKSFASLTAEMNEQKKKLKLEWTPTMDENFKTLKEEFLKSPVRAPPRFNSPEPFQLTTDYSSTAIAAVLSQVQDGEERVIGCMGRKCTGAEKRYPSWKGEMSAIIYGIRKFHHILSYKKFIINTDSKALTYFNSLKANAGMVSRWAEELQSYDFTVLHRPGRLNVNADCLSRRVGMPEPEPEEEQEQAEYVGTIDTPEEIDFGKDLQREIILKRQAEDEILKMVRIWVCQGHVPEKKDLRGLHQDAQQYAQRFETIKIQEDGILAQEIDTALGYKVRILVPSSLQEAVFNISHQHSSAGHFGVVATAARIRRNFWYPGMSTDIRTRVGTCLECLAKVTKEKLAAGVHIPQKSGFPLQTLFVDLVGPLPLTAKGHQYILSVQDGYSRFICLYPLVSKEAKGVVNTLVDQHIKLFGCPGRIHSDNGTEFVNTLMTGMKKRLEICHTRGPPYNPQSNQVERFHKTLASMLRVLLPREDTEWDQHLAAITLAYNTKVNQSTGVTPSLAFLGREAKLPVDLVIRTPDAEFETQDHGVRHMLSRYNKVYNYYSKRQEGCIRRNAKRYAGTAHYEIGDEVWYLSSRRVPGKPAKLTDHWTGPWVVESKVADVLYRIRPKDPNSPHKTMTANVSRMKKMARKSDRDKIPNNIAFDREEEDSDGEELHSEAPHTSIHVPVYTPSHYPMMRDVGAPAPRQADRVEERMDPPQLPQVVQDAITPPPQEAPTVDAPVVMEEALTASTSGEGATGIKRGREETPAPFVEDSNKRRDTQEREKGTWGRFKQDMKEYEAVALEDPSPPSTDDEMGHLAPFPLNTLCIPIKSGARAPYKATKYSAGYDIYIPTTTQLPPGKITAVDLGLSLALPANTYLQLASRSGLAKKGIQVIAGIIDPDYRGSIKVLFVNNTNQPFTFHKGQRCCQALLIRFENAVFKAVDVLPGTERGSGGFGHTG